MTKTTILASALAPALLLAFLASPARACDSPDGCPDINVFLDLQRFDASNNGCNNRFGQDVSLKVARQASAGRIDVEAFKQAFSASCNADTADTVGLESRNGSIDARAFTESYRSAQDTDMALAIGRGQRSGRLSSDLFLDLQRFDASNNGCNNRYGKDISYRATVEAGAGRLDADSFKRAFSATCSGDTSVTVGAEARSGRINVEGFTNAYRTTRNTDLAFTVGRGEASGSLPQGLFNELQQFDASNNGCNRFGPDVALRATREAGSSQLSAALFMREFAFSRLCKADLAFTVAEGAKAGTLSAGVYEDMQSFDASSNGCNNRFGTDIALKIARLAVRDEINVETFRKAFSATCNVDTAFALACAGRQASLAGERRAVENDDALKDAVALSTPAPASPKAAASSALRVD